MNNTLDTSIINSLIYPTYLINMEDFFSENTTDEHTIYVSKPRLENAYKPIKYKYS